MIMKAEIGKRIQEIRKRRGVQQKALAEAVGWSDRQTVSDIEHGKREVNLTLTLNLITCLYLVRYNHFVRHNNLVLIGARTNNLQNIFCIF